MSRVPPHSVEAERSILGAILLNNDVFPHALLPEQFYRSGHQIIFSTIRDLRAAGIKADLVTVTQRLRDSGQLEKAGGAAYVGNLTDNVPSVEAAEHYTYIVAEKASKRALIDAARAAASEAYGDADLDKITSGLLSRVHGLTPGSEAAKSVRELCPVMMANLERLHAGAKPAGISTGWTDVDRLTLLYPGDLIVLGGRPGMGKSGAALDVGLHAAQEGHSVLIASLEMPAQQVMNRLASKLSGVDGSLFRTGRFEDRHWPQLSRAFGELQDLPIRIDSTPAVSTGHLRGQAERMKREGGLGLVIIDYLQLMEEPGKWEGRERFMIGRITRGLKRLAKELEIPVILLSQLSREVEKRSPPCPRLSDLRESGEIEQDADAVWLLYRPEYYKRDDTPADLRGVGILQVEKSREARTGEVNLRWVAHTTSYRNYARD